MKSMFGEGFKYVPYQQPEFSYDESEDDKWL